MKNTKYIIGAITFFLFYLFLSFEFYSSAGIAIFTYFSTKFFFELGVKIEIKDIIIIISALQWVIGPLLAYKIFPDNEFYFMAVDIDEYMGFVVPAVYCFSLGLYFPLVKNNTPQSFYLDKISAQLKKNKNLDLILIGSGIFIEAVRGFFPSSLAFFAVLLSSIRFIGLFFLLISNRKNKWWIIAFVLLNFFALTLGRGMFHQLILWLTFFIIIAAFITKPSFLRKLLFSFLFIFFLVTLQTIKSQYRSALADGATDKAGKFTELVQEQVLEGSYISSEQNLGAMVVRINQGWIIARIMSWTPKHEPFGQGETIIEALEAVFMPRFLFPDKIIAGGRTYFTRFTGKKISDSTSMGLSLLGEAYANFGKNGGAFFLFIIGLFYNIVIYTIFRVAKKNPTLILFLPLIFLQVVKAETDFSVIINHLFKAIITVFIIYKGFKVIGIKV